MRIFPEGNVLHALRTGNESFEIRTVKLLLFDREIFARTEVEAFPRLQTQPVSRAGSVLGGDILFDGVLVGMDHVEAPAVHWISKKFRDRVAEDVAVMPATLGGLRLQLDGFHTTHSGRCFIHGPAQCGDFMTAPDHFSRRLEHITLHPAEGSEGADDVENPHGGKTSKREDQMFRSPGLWFKNTWTFGKMSKCRSGVLRGNGCGLMVKLHFVELAIAG